MQVASISRRPKTRDRPGVGHIILLVANWALLIVAILLGLAGALLSLLGTAGVTSNPVVFLLAAPAAQLVITVGIAGLAAAGIVPRRQWQLALGVGIGATVCTAAIAGVLLFRPLATPAAQSKVPAPAGVAYWNLDTGSRIAYLKVPSSAPGSGGSKGSAAATPVSPVIRVHGGPGAYAVSNERFMPLYRDLAAEGFDVYVYDQIGSGLSARLTNPAEYTLARHTADLEAIRRQIGTEQVILIADSWGATLASTYMAAHPERVARVIFTSPAVMDYSEWRDTKWQDITARLPEAQRQQISDLQSQPRFLALVLLSRLNPRAAYNVASDAELDSFFDEWTGKMLPGMVCDPARFPRADAPHGFGFWANVMSGSDASLHSRGQRAALATNRTPVLILKGECDYIQWDVAYQYRTTLPNSTVLYIPGAGHAIYYDRPDLYSQVVRAFLRDRPLPLPPYEGSTPPK